jgi:hypothetical protein
MKDVSHWSQDVIGIIINAHCRLNGSKVLIQTPHPVNKIQCCDKVCLELYLYFPYKPGLLPTFLQFSYGTDWDIL